MYRYILNNPKKAGICAAEKYLWSSFREYGGNGGLTDSRLLASMIGSEADFLEFLQQEDTTEHMELDNPKKDDEWAMSIIRELLQIESGTQLQQFGKDDRDNALALLKEQGISIRQLERLTGINRGIVQKAKRVKENRPQ